MMGWPEVIWIPLTTLILGAIMCTISELILKYPSPPKEIKLIRFTSINMNQQSDSENMRHRRDSV